MNQAEPIPPPNGIDVLKLARAIRFALVSIVLGLSYLSLRSSLSIGPFERIFHDMLGGKPLPFITQVVIYARPLIVAVSVLVPIITFATLFFRNLIASFYTIGILGFVTIVQFIMCYCGLIAPLTAVIKAMGAP
jgi:hypothetical protein